jgi:nucleotide-binding universal stress UspA family protein
MIKSLLVPVDSSEYARSALQQALGVARPCGGRIVGLHVLDIRLLEMPFYLDHTYSFEAIPPTMMPLDAIERYRLKGESVLNDLKDTVESAGVEVETITEEGVPAQVIAGMGKTYDLVVMGKRGESAKWGTGLLGPTAESVVRRSDVPVLLAEEDPRTLRRMMLMFDGSAPATRALKLVADLVACGRPELLVLTVDDDEARGKATQGEAAAYLESAGVEASYMVRPGRPDKVAPKILEDELIDLLVLGTKGYSILFELILGSTAEHLMRVVRLPVLLVP